MWTLAYLFVASCVLFALVYHPMAVAIGIGVGIFVIWWLFYNKIFTIYHVFLVAIGAIVIIYCPFGIVVGLLLAGSMLVLWGLFSKNNKKMIIYTLVMISVVGMLCFTTDPTTWLIYTGGLTGFFLSSQLILSLGITWVLSWLVFSINRKIFIYGFMALVGLGFSFTGPNGPKQSQLITPPLLLGVKEQVELFVYGWAPKITLEIGAVCAQLGAVQDTIVGKSVEDASSFAKLHEVFVESTVKNRSKLPADFKFFGSGNNKLNLETILKHNPLYGMHLTSVKSADGKLRFEINSCVIQSNKKLSLYARLVNSGNATFNDRVLVNAKFDENLKLTWIAGFNRWGQVLTGYSESELCGYLLNSIRFASQLIHGAMHVHNAVLVSAMYVASKHSPIVSEWSEQYLPQILVKNWQVQAVLISKTTGMFSGLLTLHDNVQADAVRILGEVVQDWGSYTTADEFNKKFLLETLVHGNVTEQDLTGSGLFAQYFKHTALISGYSEDLYKAFETCDDKTLQIVDQALEKYLAKVDVWRPWNIRTVQHWIESMSVIGIAHGFVPGLTRLELTPEVLGKDFLYGRTKKVFTTHDFLVIGLLVGTLTGTQAGYSVFSATRSQSLLAPVRKVADYYDQQSAIIKQNYYDEVLNEPNYRDVGFILNDGIIDTVDSRQLTLTTYI